MVPHFAAELLEQLLGKSLEDCEWPVVDEKCLVENDVTLVVQVNGKLRAQLTVPKDIEKNLLVEQARQAAERWLVGDIEKTVVVPGKLVNFVVKIS